MTKTKTCTRCKEAKPETAFHRDGRNGRYAMCAPCRAEVRSARGREKRNKPPEQELKENLWRNYRLTLEQYGQIRDAQGGVCAICQKPPAPGKRLVVDHCHSTGVVRALLCGPCNTAVGIYEIHHRAAAAYLAEYGRGNPLIDPDAPRARPRQKRRRSEAA
ncbi:endonuclease VII domain-containing protein [Streptomyces griseorubiginosus]|jgi:hypothetical protein|uniref:endonuclease VII domain-containing protein n=1 Tax=Streptomyces griseorubiginosus TaxID=67304 RepID=UPI0036EAB2D7